MTYRVEWSRDKNATEPENVCENVPENDLTRRIQNVIRENGFILIHSFEEEDDV